MQNLFFSGKRQAISPLKGETPESVSPLKKAPRLKMSKLNVVQGYSPKTHTRTPETTETVMGSVPEKFLNTLLDDLDMTKHIPEDADRGIMLNLINAGFLSETLEVKLVDGSVVSIMNIFHNKEHYNFNKRLSDTEKGLENLQVSMNNKQTTDLKKLFEEELNIQLVGDLDLGSPSSNKGWKLQEEIRKIILEKLDNSNEANQAPKTYKDIAHNTYLEMYTLIKRVDIIAMGTVKEDKGKHTVLTQFKLKTRKEIDLLRKVGATAEFRPRSSVPVKYKAQKTYLMRAIEKIKPEGHWVRIDTRIGKDPKPEWVVMMKPSNGTGWQVKSKAFVCVHQDEKDFKAEMDSLIASFTTSVKGGS